MRALTTVLFVNDSGPAPRAGISVEIDGQPVITKDDVAPADWVAVIAGLSEAAGADLQALLSEPLTELITRLETSVAEGRAAQEAREEALVAWQAVAPTETTP